MELHYSRSATNSMGDPIKSFIFYGAEIDKIRTIYRNHGELSKEKQIFRIKEVARVTNPDLYHRASRKLRIFFNVFNDAIGEALNVF